ncbi:unnamed protein product [Auanema sp. JU1783]|nr:unnamed protein product [Auanema sp. JU1783]
MGMKTVPSPEDIFLIRNMIKSENKTKFIMDMHRKLVEMNLLKAHEMRNETTCDDYVDQHPDLTNEPFVMIIFATLYIHIFVLGLIGNFAILLLTFRHRQLQTVQNIFISNLAISDILVCLTSLPITPITSVYKTWFFASPVCKLLPLVQGASIFVSTFSHSAIAYDRYNLVVRPHKHPVNTRGASIVSLCLWIASVIVCMPYGWYMEVVEIRGLCGEYCTEKWPLPEVRKSYAILVLLMQFLFPFATMAVCYYKLFSRLRERAESKLKKISERTQLLENATTSNTPGPHSTASSTSNSNIPDDSGEHRNSVCEFEKNQKMTVLAQQRRTTMILVSMVLLFGVCWLPHNVIGLMIEYDEAYFHYDHMDHTYIVSMTAHFIAMLTNVVNPILYAWLNPCFKEILLKSLKRRRGHPEVTKNAKNTIIRIKQPVTTHERSF